MKILKKGKINRPIFRATCGWCNSDLEYREEEVHESSENHRDGLSHMIVCPVCKRLRWVYNIVGTVA